MDESSEDTPQVLDIPAIPQVHDSNTYDEACEEKTEYRKSQLLAEHFEVPLKVAYADSRTMFCSEDKFSVAMAFPVRELLEYLSQFGREGYESVLVSLTYDTQNKVVIVKAVEGERQDFTRPKSRVSDDERYDMRPCEIHPEWLERSE